MADPFLERLKYYRGEIQFQSQMLSGRVDALISSQSFLVLSYATVMAGLLGRWSDVLTWALPPALAVLGLVLTLQSIRGITTAVKTIERWQNKEGDLLDERQDLAPFFLDPKETFSEPGRGKRTDKRVKSGLSFARYAPWVLSIAWVYFGSLAMLMSYRSR